jgi:hypothetical protein
MNVRHFPARLVAGALALASTPALAGMGTIASSYGLLPGDVASAQALSLFNADAAAVHYNPASLVADPRGELTVGMGYVDHQVEADSLGGTAPVQRQGELLAIDESRSTLLGLKTNLSSLTKVEHPLYFGLMLGVEKYGREMLAFNSGTSTGGQSFRYGKQPLFLAAGGGMQLLPGLDGGLAFRVTLQSSARLTGQTDLAGNSQYEQLDVVAEPKMTPVVGLGIDWARLGCGDGDCAPGRWRTALAWRAASTAETRVNANVVIPGTIPPPGLDIALATLDSYQPETASLGLQYQGERVRVALTGEWQRWSALGEEFRDDTIRDQANLRFRDIVIPRLGAEWRVGEAWRLTTGIAYEESVLDSDRSLDVNYLDNDRYLLGLGASVEVRDPPVLAYPVRLELGYQLQWLKDRSFLLTSTQSGGTAPYEALETRGQVHVLVGSLTMKF